MSDKYLLLPKSCFKTKQQLRAEMPMFSVRTFESYYKDDAEAFEKLVESKCGIVACTIRIPFLNFENQQVSLKYITVYQYYENIGMEVKC